MRYYYLLGDQDFNDNVTWHGPISVTTGSPAIDRLALGPCLPNPSRGQISISYQLPSPGRTRLKVFDICGRLVKTLTDADQPPGRYRAVWDGVDDLGRAAASGVYFYRLEAMGASLTGKLTLLH
jgi:hypothetical protein